ncbi:UDP-N-acetylmuramoyl-tripeptide--D-alanyl-D-alanine ligase [Actinosynnema sp. NPDC047251]|uniref:UDP-N-acetylmuramoyl-tripeptide--D-alanyl-D-alanine ligase n=1 Tax=Saccharothrix espanaensis (strain ATCC 51144 / DSM 44229 / JCM 9112 / NBRC 15066 / NRRL 15764) TaxID=1179773 RepID=K0KC32_SACES|nr:UDP-N-acetylmuramoyl-tripeptide--D-alanyl-D-alanine ligase [Saccharothrix espanaensis]CCH34153.1 UDP-N-acetylmuramoyl-tripeptide-D-alanyl-D-alanine ligase [Saccharothrix espanaensis DSM 44229]
MIPLSLAEIAEVVGGTLHGTDGSPVVTGSVEFDSREIGAGGLYVALPGARVDGHDFAAEVVAAGAAGVLAGRPVDGPAVIAPPVESGHGNSYVLADDADGAGAAVLAALAKLARHVVDRLPELTVVGVTGSSGKTTTKDLIAAVLAPLGRTVAPPGSFNNELGHPWTVLRADADTRFLVLELSARGTGHIADLCRVAPPKVGVVLNVGSAHLGEFGSREGIAQAKGELVEALPADGVAILNADDPLVAGMAPRTAAKVVLVGESGAAAVRAVDIELDGRARAGFRLVTPAGEADVRLAVHGPHQVGNALSAAAVALELGATPQQVADALGNAERVSEHRMALSERPDGVTVVNDAYNANPESVRAALKSLATISRATAPARRSWAVLGAMAELGADHVRAHDEIGRLAVRLDINKLVVVGPDARPMHQGAHLEGSWGEEAVLVPDVAAAVELLRDQVRPGDVVLVKASKTYGLWRVAEALLEAVGK